MAHRCNYKVEFELDNEKIKTTYWAYWENKKLDVLEHTLFLNGKEEIKGRDNLRFAVLGGWFVAFPDEKETMRYYSYGNSKTKLCDYKEWKKMPSLYYEEDSENNLIDRLKNIYPEYRYLIQKLANNDLKGYATIYKYLQLAKKYPDKLSQMEWLVENRQHHLITETNLKKGFDKNLINFIKDNLDNWVDLQACKLAIKNNVSYAVAKRCKDYFLSDLKLEEYLNKQNESLTFYKDYKKMCKELKKNWNDPYWHYPSDLRKQHNKVAKEIKAQKEAQFIKENEIICKELKEKMKYSLKTKAVEGKLEFYFPYDLEDIKNHAEVLSQCLITAKYYVKYAKGETILCFIKKDNKPYATAELKKNKEIKQFYMDEKDREKCNPTPKLKEAMNRFLQTLPKEIRV